MIIQFPCSDIVAVLYNPAVVSFVPPQDAGHVRQLLQ